MYVCRKHYTLKSFDGVAPKLVGATCFSKLDTECGFWQIPLEEKSRLITTFITPFRRFALTSAPEIFQRKMTELLHNPSCCLYLKKKIKRKRHVQNS